MNVKTADLKNNLSKYLRRVRAGKTFTVFDRDTPIATLSPVVPAATDDDVAWQRERAATIAKYAKAGVHITPPLKRPPSPIFADIMPSVAPDGRTDIKTIDLVRGGRDY